MVLLKQSKKERIEVIEMEEMNKYEQIYQDSIGKWISKAKAIRLKCLDCCVY